MTDSNVITLSGTHPGAAARVLEDAAGEGLADVIVLGWTADRHFYMHTSIGSAPEAAWLLDLAKLELLDPTPAPDDPAAA